MGTNQPANGQLVKGAGCGTRGWNEDFALTFSDGLTKAFGVARDGSGEIAGSFQVAAQSGLPAAVGGTAGVNLGSNATAAGTSAQTLKSLTLPANYLQSAGKGVRIRAWGTTAANNNNKTVSLKFGSTVVATSGVVAANAAPWYLEAFVYRDTDGNQFAVSTGASSGSGGNFAVATSAPAEDLTGTIAVAMSATDGTSSAGDVVCSALIVEYVG